MKNILKYTAIDFAGSSKLIDTNTFGRSQYASTKYLGLLYFTYLIFFDLFRWISVIIPYCFDLAFFVTLLFIAIYFSIKLKHSLYFFIFFFFGWVLSITVLISNLNFISFFEEFLFILRGFNSISFGYFFSKWVSRRQISQVLIFLFSVQLLQLFSFIFLAENIIPYSRVSGGAYRTTSIFYEPAFFSQFLFWVLALRIVGIQARGGIVLIAVATLLTQSLGGLFAFLSWMTYTWSQRKLTIKRGLMIFSAFVATWLFFDQMSFLRPIQGAFDLFELFSQMSCENNGTSIYRRLFADPCVLIWTYFENIVGFLFGITGFNSTELRILSGIVPNSDEVAGNGLIELVLNYGLLWTILLLLTISIYCGKRNFSKTLQFFVFVFLITQIDGAIAKPHLIFYIASFVFLLKGSKSK